jgi:hypothetical protein
MTIDDPRKRFVRLIDLSGSRVLLAPHITFICGGPVDISATSNHSIRNMFMNLSAGMSDKSEGFTLAENFKDWQSGYSNLADFENDIAALASVIVVILESPGALAELGLFFANPELRKKMVVVVHSGHHSSESFIKFGLLNPLETEREESVLVYEIDNKKIDDITQDEVKEIVEDVFAINEKIEKTSAFTVENHGHIVFLIFQIIYLFTIVTFSEIEDYISELDIKIKSKVLRSILYILRKFNLIEEGKRSSQVFYFVKPNISNRVDISFKRDMANPDTPRRYDTRAVKLEVLAYYEEVKKENRSFSQRITLWNQRTDS